MTSVRTTRRRDVFRAASSRDELVPLFDAFPERENSVAFIALAVGAAVGCATATLHDRPGDVLVRAEGFVPGRHWPERPL